MSYKSFYGLCVNPFDKQSVREEDRFESEDMLAMMNRLNYLREVRGFGVFTAAPGMGKSYCLRCFEHSLNRSLYDTRYLCLSTVSVGEFYKLFCETLGLETKGGKTVMFRAIQDRISYLYRERKQPLIIVIDEAQYLSNSILKDLKMLMNFSYDSINCFTLILSGEPYLNATLERPVHEALRQCITVHYTFRGLQDHEIIPYIRHKLRLAGGPDTMIDEAALNALANYCHGNPRIIDNIMTAALNDGAAKKRTSIDAEIIMEAANELSLE